VAGNESKAVNGTLGITPELASDIHSISLAIGEQRMHEERRRASDAHVIGAAVAGLAIVFLAVVGYDEGHVLDSILGFVTKNVSQSGLVAGSTSGLVLIGYQAYRLEYLHPIVVITVCLFVTLLLIWATTQSPPSSIVRIGSFDPWPALFVVMAIVFVGSWLVLETRRVNRTQLVIGAVVTVVAALGVGWSIGTNDANVFWASLGFLVVSGLTGVTIPAWAPEDHNLDTKSQKVKGQ
jgi:hypothetical protein